MQIDTSLLKGKHVYLELLREDHVPVFRQLAKNERIWEYTRTLLIDDSYDEQFDRYIKTAFDEKNMIGQYSFVICDAQTHEMIGSTRYYKFDAAQKRLSIGYTWYIPRVWGGIENKECKFLLLQYAFEKLKFQRVEFEVAHENIRSQKAVTKIGGVFEGILRKHGLHADGSLRDTFVYSIIDDEWPAVKERLQKLLG